MWAKIYPIERSVKLFKLEKKNAVNFTKQSRKPNTLLRQLHTIHKINHKLICDDKYLKHFHDGGPYYRKMVVLKVHATFDRVLCPNRKLNIAMAIAC